MAAAFPDFGLEEWLEMAKRTLVVSQNGRISPMITTWGSQSLSNSLERLHQWICGPGFDALVRCAHGAGARGIVRSACRKETQEPRWAKRNPAMSAVTVPRVGHAPTLDEPEARAAIDALLARVLRPSSMSADSQALESRPLRILHCHSTFCAWAARSCARCA